MRSWPRFAVSQRQIAAALLLLPSILTGAFASFIASRRDPPQPAPADVAKVKPKPVITKPIDRDFAAILPKPVLPRMSPAIDQPIEIPVAALRLPGGPPDIPAIRPGVEVPLRTFALALSPPTVDPAPIPFVAPDIKVPALPITVASLSFELLQPPTPAPSHAPTEQCVAEAGFTLLPNPKLPTPSISAPYEAPDEFGLRLAEAARAQTASLVIYNARYSRIAYPGGDVSPFYGVCTDVVVRAYRSLGIDLQVEVADAAVGTGDRNIDHRRTEVMRKFLAKRGQSLAISDNPDDFKPGDIVTYYRPQNRSSTSHIAIVSDVVGPSGQLMIVHNRGWGVQLEDALFVDKITGHYRYTGRGKAVNAIVAAARPAPAIANRALTVTAGDGQRIKPKTPGGSTVAKAGAIGRALP